MNFSPVSAPTIFNLPTTNMTETIAIIRSLMTIIAAMPSTLAMLGKLRAAFGNDNVQEAIKALGEFIDKISPPAPTADSTGSIPANPKREQQRRFFRFMNRTRLAGQIGEGEVQVICERNFITPYTESNR